MATDARLSVGLASHPKTKKLVRRLGGDGAWRLVCLFLFCASSRPDGSLAGMSDEDIELAVDWNGDEGAFVGALRDVGFLDGQEGASSIHDWEEHNPWAAGSEARSEKSRWAALCKQYGRPEAARRMPEYAKRIGVASDGPAVGNPEQYQEVPTAVPDSASGTPLADSGSAPSPLPIPSPSPLPTPETTAGAAASASPEGSFADPGLDLEPGAACPAEPKPKASKALGLRELVGFGVDAQHAEDWLKVRKAKKAPLTATAWDDVVGEAAKAGITPPEAVKIAAARGWQGFRAAWMDGQQAARPGVGAKRHGNFERQDYRAGVGADGSF